MLCRWILHTQFFGSLGDQKIKIGCLLWFTHAASIPLHISLSFCKMDSNCTMPISRLDSQAPWRYNRITPVSVFPIDLLTICHPQHHVYSNRQSELNWIRKLYYNIQNCERESWFNNYYFLFLVFWNIVLLFSKLFCNLSTYIYYVFQNDYFVLISFFFYF